MKTVQAVWYLHCIVVARVLALDYCYRNCGPQKHVLCNAVKCAGAICEENEPDFEWRSTLVQEHNNLRMIVAKGGETRNGNSAASNMRALSYDLELEVTAACTLYRIGLEPQRCISTPRFYLIGLSTFVSKTLDPSTVANTKAVLHEWYGEVANMSTGAIDKYPTRRTEETSSSRFTQLVWAHTTHVGCARCRNNDTFMMMCLYGPSGNIPHHTVYHRGPPATSCNRNTKPNPKYPALCGESEMPVNATEPGLQMDFIKVRGSSRRSRSSALVLLATLSVALHAVRVCALE